MGSPGIEARENYQDQLCSCLLPEMSTLIRDLGSMREEKESYEFDQSQPDVEGVIKTLSEKLEKIPHFLLAVGQDTRILYANDVARKSLHVGSLSNIVGKSLLQFTSQNLDNYIIRCFREKLNGVQLSVKNAFPRAQSDLDNLYVYYENFNGVRLVLLVSLKSEGISS